MFHKILLYDGPPLVISPSLAKRFGVNEALVLQQIYYWMNPSFNKNMFEGKYWVHNTYTQWQKQFPFWNLKKIRRLFNALEDLGILLSFTTCQNFSKVKYYTIDYRKIYEGQKSDVVGETEEISVSNPWVNRGTSNSPKMAHGYTQKELIDVPTLEKSDAFDLNNSSEEVAEPQENKGFSPGAKNEHTDGPDMGTASTQNGLIDESVLEQTEDFSLKNRAEKMAESQENRDFSPWAKNGHTDEPDMGSGSTQNGLIDGPVLEKAKDFDLKNRSTEAAEPQENRDFSPWAKNGHIDEPDMGYGSAQKWPMEVPKSGLSYKDTEITKKDISFLPPLTPPSFSNFGKKEGMNEKEKNRKRRGQKRSIKNNQIRKDIAVLKDPDFCQTLMDVWNQEIQNKLTGSEILLTPERSQKLEVFLTETLKNDFEAWGSYCQKISHCRFLMGDTKSGFRVTFDWAVESKNALKVLSGAIYDKPETQPDSGKLVEKSWPEYSQILKEHCALTSCPDAWFEVCEFLSRTWGQAIFENWFKTLQPHLKDAHTLWLITDTPFLRDYIRTHYRSSLELAIGKAFPSITHFEIRTAESSSKPQDVLTEAPLCRSNMRQSVGKDLRPDSQGDALVSINAGLGSEAPGSAALLNSELSE